MALKFSQTQQQSQKQIQKLSQLQIQSLKYLEMNTLELRHEIFSEVEKNPALEILSDGLEDNSTPEKTATRELTEYTKIGKASEEGERKSQAYQEILESSPDTRETLSDHMLLQLEMIQLPDNQRTLCEKLINNLDDNGFHILAPESFMDYTTDTDEDLEKCISLIQKLDPEACCCRNITESLLVQAKAKDYAPEAALFLLDGHLEFLAPPQPAKVLKKIRDFVKDESEKAFNTKDYSFTKDFHEEDIAQAITFIQQLNPHPAEEYKQVNNAYIFPDIKVTAVPLDEDEEYTTSSKAVSKGINQSFVISKSSSILPEVIISKDYKELLNNNKIDADTKAKMNQMVQDGSNFIDFIQYREDSVFSAAIHIVKAQLDFFENGPGHLKVFRQKDLADIMGLHETTISRIANSKFLQCDWGLFPFKYFFVSGIAQNESLEQPSSKETTETATDAVSKDKILFAIKSILDAQPPDAKKLSDQKLSDMLSEQGIKVARRTIAKYRSQLGVASSYDR